MFFFEPPKTNQLIFEEEEAQEIEEQDENDLEEFFDKIDLVKYSYY